MLWSGMDDYQRLVLYFADIGHLVKNRLDGWRVRCVFDLFVAAHLSGEDHYDTIAMWLMKVLFPNDTKTLGVLREMYAKLKAAIAVKRTEHQEKRNREENQSH